MESSGNRLLDLLKSSESNRKKADRDLLHLPLFDPHASIGSQASSARDQNSPAPMNGAISSRNSNANDLLASLMGNASPRSLNTPESRAAESANLLSSLMGSSGGNKVTSPTAVAAAAAAAATTATSPPTRSYVNPKHEFLTASVAPISVELQNQTGPPASAFQHDNPFEELEAAVAPLLAHANTNIVAPKRTQRNSSSQQASSKPSASTSPLPKQVPTPSSAPPSTSHKEQKAKMQPTVSNEQVLKEAPKVADQAGDAYRLPDTSSSVCKIPGLALPRRILSNPTPVTKMTIQPDQSNRNIIAASRKYFAYPVSKGADVCGIRIVDQDTGETTLLSEHISKVIDLDFAKWNDEDGNNALVSTDIDSNVFVWSISGTSNITKVLEIGGPSDTSHKSRAKFNRDGIYLGVSITSRIYVFDYRSINAGPRLAKIKLHPDSKHTICVCKAEKAIKDFSFSPDNTSIAGVDKLGKIRLWVLGSNSKSIDPVASMATGERSLLSIEFLGPAHIAVGTPYNDSILLVDLKSAKIAQEVSLPASSSVKTFSARPRLLYLPESHLLLLNNELRQSLYVLRADLPTSEGQTGAIISALSEASSHIEAAGRFSTILELGLPIDQEGRVLGFSGVSNGNYIDCFVAHERGYSLHSIDSPSITTSFANAQALDPSACTKLKTLGHFINSSTQKATVEDERRPARQSSPDLEVRPSPRPQKKGNPALEARSNGSLVTEPRTAEIAARIEASVKSSVVAELQKSNGVIRSHVEDLQKSNDAKHEVVLRLVSETLSKNTTKFFQSTLNDAIEQSILPSLKAQIDSAIKSQLPAAITDLLDSRISRELSESIKEAVEVSFNKSGISSHLSTATTSMTHDLTTRHQRMEQSLAGALVRLDAQILERQKEDSEKIDKMMSSITSLEKQINVLSASLAQRPQVPAQNPIVTQPLAAGLNRPQSTALPNGSKTQPKLQPSEDFTKYHDLIMDFVTKTQRISVGNYEGVPFIKQFLSWQPDIRVKDGICRSLSADQLQLLAFVHALASELKEEDAFTRVHWIASSLSYLKTDTWDPRLEILGPRLFSIISQSLRTAREAAPPASQYQHLLEVLCSRLPA